MLMVNGIIDANKEPLFFKSVHFVVYVFGSNLKFMAPI